jgi:glycosyltransferase involved in cell wall biosynthesis
MRILFLTPRVPYPARSGGTIKTASLLSHLGRRHEVGVATFCRGPLSEEQARWVDDHGDVDTVVLDRGRTPINLVASYAVGVPLSVYRNRSGRMASLVADRLRVGRYGAVFVDHWLMAQYVPRWFTGVRLLHQHNAEAVMWERHAAVERNVIRRAMTRAEHRRVRRYEASILDRFDRVFAVSEPDRRAMLELGADPEHFAVLPNVPDPELLERPGLSWSGAERVVLFVGSLGWHPNIEGVDRFLRDVFPLVRGKLPDVRFILAGTDPPRRLIQLVERTPGAVYVGPTDDPEALYRRAAAFVEASRSGGGTRLKVLNALARGLPVVSSPEGCHGLDVVPGEHLLVADEAGSMADSLMRLMGDEPLWRALSERGRALIRSTYRSEVAFRPLDAVLADGPGRG